MASRNLRSVQMSAEQVALRLGGREVSPGDWRIPHLCGGLTTLGDNPGLSLTDGVGGTFLVHCHYGCDQADAFAAVMAALGREPSSGAGSPGGSGRVYGDSVVLSLSVCPSCGEPGFSASRPRWASSYAPYLLLSCSVGCSYGSIHKVAADLVVERTGNPWLQRVPYRLSNGNSRYRFRRDPSVGRKGSWESEGKGQKTKGLSPLLWTEAAGAAVLCEGDKAAAALASCLDGQFAVYSAGDSSALKSADYSALADLEVILWLDNDPAGLSAGRRAAARLSAMGCSLRQVDVSSLPENGDAADLSPKEISELLASATPPEILDVSGAGLGAGSLDASDFTHVGDAWRILARHGHRVLLATPSDREERHRIYVLDESTGIWRGGPEPLEGVHSDTAKAYAADAGAAFASGLVDGYTSRARLAWAKRTQGSGGAAEAGRMLPTAASEMARAGLDSGVTVRLSSELDPPGRYLGCANGVVDLDTGRLLPPAEAAACLITLAAVMPYVPASAHELVEGLARHVPGEEREFLLDSFAYALRGIPDRRFIVMAGPPNGGKSSVREAMAAALGESLAFSLPQNSLLQEKYPHRNQHNAGLTKLLTHRFAMASEIPGGNTPVDAGQLKTVSGGDSMALREPNERHREDRPVSATLFLCLNTERDGCNDLDRLPLQDAAVRDRVQIVLMPEVPGDRDPRVIRQLRSKAVATALLAELVRRARGMEVPPVPPASVRETVMDRYASSAGYAVVWVPEHLELTGMSSDWVTPVRLHEELSAWIVSQGGEPYPEQQDSIAAIRAVFGLPSQGAKRVEGKVVRAYLGLRII